MATVKITNLTDDLNADVTEDVETVTYFDPATGEKREIELGTENRDALEAVLSQLATFTEVSRPVAVAKPKAAKNDENAKIRTWALANGFQIGDRGRIKAEIVKAYQDANSGTPVDEAQANTQARVDETGFENAPAELQIATKQDIQDALDEVLDTPKASE